MQVLRKQVIRSNFHMIRDDAIILANSLAYTLKGCTLDGWLAWGNNNWSIWIGVHITGQEVPE